MCRPDPRDWRSDHRRALAWTEHSLGLILEVVSIGIIIIVITAFFVRIQGTVIDPPQLKVTASNFTGVFSAFAGIFFTVMAYLMVFGIGDDTDALGKSAAPFGAVAARAGLPWASTIVYFAAMISVFACALASITAAARLLFSMGKYRFLHPSMGLVHDTHRTPHCAILLCGGLLALICVAMLRAGLLTAFGCAGTFASFGFVIVYFALCIVAPIDLKKSNEMKFRHLALGAVGAALMMFVVVASVYPMPVYPYNILRYVFFGYMAVGAAWFALLKAKSPQILASIQHDMEI